MKWNALFLTQFLKPNFKLEHMYVKVKCSVRTAESELMMVVLHYVCSLCPAVRTVCTIIIIIIILIIIYVHEFVAGWIKVFSCSCHLCCIDALVYCSQIL